MLEIGKKYSWYIKGKRKIGIFTGKYTKSGNAILVEADVLEYWVVPEEECSLVN